MKLLQTVNLRALVGVAAAATLVACSTPPGGENTVDSDGDELIDTFEVAIGTDPGSDDTDGDGFTDSEEYLNYFDPDDDMDFPRAGDYPRQARPSDLEGEGTDVGEVLEDFARVDQYNEEISLHEFYGNVVVLSIGADW
jgi:hypothetical protein